MTLPPASSTPQTRFSSAAGEGREGVGPTAQSLSAIYPDQRAARWHSVGPPRPP
jgi:hypothetical protein